MRPRWRFDLDGTLVDSLSATHVRPHAVDLLEALRAHRCEITVWSAGGIEYASGVVARVALAPYVDEVMEKRRGSDGWWQVGDQAGELACVDDQPEGLPPGVEVHAVFPYVGANRHDRALLDVIRALPSPGSR
jgi:beta-phosphoglucomutase-like phosphatase (HAD superfamily)